MRPALLLGKLPGEYDDWLICMISSQIFFNIRKFFTFILFLFFMFLGGKTSIIATRLFAPFLSFGSLMFFAIFTGLLAFISGVKIVGYPSLTWSNIASLSKHEMVLSIISVFLIGFGGVLTLMSILSAIREIIFYVVL